jgi:hypothetical protein
MVKADAQETGVLRYQRPDLAALATGASGTRSTEVDPPRRTVTRFVRSCTLPTASEAGL